MFDMDKCKVITTPLSSSTYDDQIKSGTPIDLIKYQSIIGSLLYFTTIRPNIMFSVYLYARYKSFPK